MQAKAMLDTLHAKWDPRRKPREDPQPSEELVAALPHERRNTRVGDHILFARRTDTASSISDVFRAFTKGEISEPIPDETEVWDSPGPKRIAVCAICPKAGTARAGASVGIVHDGNPEQDRAIKVPRDLPQNIDTAALLAIANIAQVEDEGRELIIEIDLTVVKTYLGEELQAHEDDGYINDPNGTSARLALANMRNRRGATVFAAIDDKIPEMWKRLNEAEKQAERALQRGYENPRCFSLETDSPYITTGARLSSLTQKKAYQGVREKKLKRLERRPRTAKMMERAQAEAQDVIGFEPTESAVWKGIRHKDIARDSRSFLYKAANDAFTLGEQWDRNNAPDEIKQRRYCHYRHCEAVDETLEHILCSCESPERRKIWDLAKALWKLKMPEGHLWPGIGMVISCGTVKFTDTLGSRKYGEERLYRILVSESARLIWRLRCRRVIEDENEPLTSQAIEDTWYKMINDRLRLDCELTNKRKYGSKAIKRRTVAETWANILQDEDQLPRNWKRASGVLVGIRSGLGDDVLMGDEEEEDDGDGEYGDEAAEHSQIRSSSPTLSA
jgi:hypothetical protein